MAGNGKALLADDLLHLELEAIVRRIRELQACVVKLQANRTCERCGEALPEPHVVTDSRNTESGGD